MKISVRNRTYVKRIRIEREAREAENESEIVTIFTYARKFKLAST